MMIDAAPPPAITRLAPIRFAPPLDRTLRYETIEERAGPAGAMRFRMEHGVRFRLAGVGYWLEMIQTGHAAAAPPRIAAMFDRAMAPFEGVVVTVAVGGNGGVGQPADAAATWAKVLAAQATLRDAVARDPTVSLAARRAATAILDQDAAASPAERDTRLGDWPAELLGFTAPDVAVGEEAAIALGEGAARLDGRVRYFRADAGFAWFALDLASPAGAAAAIERHDEVRVDRRTGLIEETVSRRTVNAPGLPPQTAIHTLRRVPDARR